MEPSSSLRSNFNPAIAAMLSALMPGLGQYYNGQWGKGALFFFGTLLVGSGLLNSGGLDHLESSLTSPMGRQDILQLLLLMVLLLALALWSVIDAVRVARAVRD